MLTCPETAQIEVHIGPNVTYTDLPVLTFDYARFIGYHTSSTHCVEALRTQQSPHFLDYGCSKRT